MDIFGQMFGAMVAALLSSLWAQKRLDDQRKGKIPDRDVWGWPWENSHWPWRRRR